MSYRPLRVIISGGGTGGHIFPAVSIADALKKANPATEILFVGAEGKMEMEKVPAAGYRIVGLPVAGLQRKLNWEGIRKNLRLPFKLLKSNARAAKILREFQPEIAVGVGGYASAPLLRAAQKRRIPTLLQEQNGFAGMTNKLLGAKARCICVAYEGMERFFPADRIVMTGNPIRADIHPYGDTERAEGLAYYGLDASKRHILIIGGSLGSATLNRSVQRWIEAGCPGGEGVEVLWQCGGAYREACDAFMAAHSGVPVKHSAFLKRMDLAYALADVVISRSGASSVSEICAAAKAAVFVPSPNVAEDHQTHNAMALVRRDAALLVRDADAPQTLMGTALALLRDPERCATLEQNAQAMALPDAAARIVEEIYKLV